MKIEYICPECKHKPFKTEKGYINHMKNKHQTRIDPSQPAEEVSPERKPGRAASALFEPSPPEITVTPESEALNREGGEPIGERRSSDPGDTPEMGIDQVFKHIAQQIQTLSKNDQLLQEQLKQIQDTQYEVIQTTENPPGFNMENMDLTGAWEKIPSKVQDAVLDVIGGVAIFLRGGPPPLSEKEQVVRAVMQIEEDNATERITTRARQIMEAMSDPTISVYTKRENQQNE